MNGRKIWPLLPKNCWLLQQLLLLQAKEWKRDIVQLLAGITDRPVSYLSLSLALIPVPDVPVRTQVAAATARFSNARAATAARNWP